MQTTIYYFSGTGNSLYVAKKIAAAVQPCRLVPIPRALKDQELLITQDERAGVVTPLYFGSLPNLVARFFTKLNVTPASYLFLIVTAGHPFGAAIPEANDCLKNKGKELSYGAYLAMPDNYLPVYNVTQAKAKHILEKTEKIIGQVIEDISGLKQIDLNKPVIKLLDVLLGPIVRAWHRNWSVSAPLEDKNFTVDEKCTSCGICKKVCPVENITLNDKLPRWNNHCEQCLACIQFCPEEAIQFGKKTINKTRYHHPSITWEEISGQK